MSAAVIGAGPNGLAAAVTLAEAGLAVTVFEAEAVPGGAARTLELTLPGFRHDVGASVHPTGAGSPCFARLPLAHHGLTWVHPPAALAHPLDDGTAVLLLRDLSDQVEHLGRDGGAWWRMMEPLARNWWQLTEDAFQPIGQVPRHPLLLARLGVPGALPAHRLAQQAFESERTRALLAGLAGHSFLPLTHPFSASFALMLAAAAHAVGWPVARGGSQSIVDALIAYLRSLGGEVRTSSPVESLGDLGDFELALYDTTPGQMLRIAGSRLSSVDHRRFAGFRSGPGVFKVDYALREPIPWRAKECSLAGTVHLGGTLEEITASEQAFTEGRCAEQPFVLLVQPSLFDGGRAPLGLHTAWAYCHVPNGSTEDMLPRIERQIERFAPGFRECVLVRHVLNPAGLQSIDRNLVGGDIGGGACDGLQMFLRPSWRYYATSDPRSYLCSASTPPGGGVHGMCGYNAARMALRRLSS